MKFLLHWPLWLSAAFVYGLFVALALTLATGIGVWARRRPVREAAVAGLVPPVGAAMLAGFLVWLALLASIELRDVDDAERAVAAEAAALRTLGLLGGIAAPAASAGWPGQLADYAGHALANEWPGMSERGPDAGTAARLDAVQRGALMRFAAESPELRAALRQAAQALVDARQARLGVAAGHIPQVIWTALLSCAVIVLSFAALIHARQARAGRWIATLLGLLIGVQVHAVYVIDRPFLGTVSVSEAPLRAAIRQLLAPPSRP